MATDERGHTVPASTDHPSRADLLNLSLSIGDAIPVANVTARAALIVTLAGIGITPSTSNPIIVWRADAPLGLQNEFTTDGSTFTSAGATGATMGTPTTTATNGTASVGTTETRDAVLGNYVFTAVAGVRYRVIIDGLLSNGNVVNDTFQVNIRNGGTSTPTAASTLVASARAFIPAAGGLGQALIPLAETFVPGAGLVTLSLFAVRLAGTGVFTPSASAAGRELYVVNLGPA